MRESILALAAKCRGLLAASLVGDHVVRPRPEVGAPLRAGRTEIVSGTCPWCRKRHSMTLCVCHVPESEFSAPIHAFSGFGVAFVALAVLPFFAGCAGLSLSGVTLSAERESAGTATVSRVTVGASFRPARDYKAVRPPRRVAASPEPTPAPGPAAP